MAKPECCQYCKFWKQENNPNEWEREFLGTRHGRCHRRAPAPHLLNTEQIMNLSPGDPGLFRLAIWPVTYRDSCCGEFERCKEKSDG